MEDIKKQIREATIAKFPITAEMETVLKFQEKEADCGLFLDSEGLFSIKKYQEYLETFDSEVQFILHLIDIGLEHQTMTISLLPNIENEDIN